MLLTAASVLAQQTFAPLNDWKSAVFSGDQASIAKFYSVEPRAKTRVGKLQVAVSKETAFRAALKKNGLTELNPRVLEWVPMEGATQLVLRISVTLGAVHQVASMR